jgi:hypothetical protein
MLHFISRTHFSDAITLLLQNAAATTRLRTKPEFYTANLYHSVHRRPKHGTLREACASLNIVNFLKISFLPGSSQRKGGA